MKHEIMALINNGRQAYVKSGALHQGEAAKAVMVESSSDLTALAGMVSPGSIAYTAGYANVWQLDAAGSWQDVTEESGGSFDPAITDPQDGDTLVYNATSGKWENGAGGGGGGAMVLTVTATSGGQGSIYSLNKTWQEIHDALAAGTQVMLVGGTDSGQGQTELTQYLVYMAHIDSDTYYISNSSVGGSTYEDTVISALGEFNTDSAEGYPNTFAYNN